MTADTPKEPETHNWRDHSSYPHHHAEGSDEPIWDRTLAAEAEARAPEDLCGEKNQPGSHPCNAPKGHAPGPEQGGHYCRYAWRAPEGDDLVAAVEALPSWRAEEEQPDVVERDAVLALLREHRGGDGLRAGLDVERLARAENDYADMMGRGMPHPDQSKRAAWVAAEYARLAAVEGRE